MNKYFNRVTLAGLAVLAMLVGTVQPVLAQTTVTQTTTSAAIVFPTQTNGPASRLIQVASATGIAVGSELFVDKEAMLVTAQNSATTTLLTVQRGYDGTAAAQHASGAIVYAGPSSGIFGSPFQFVDPPFGACVLSGEVYSIRINLANGNLWQCTNSQWLNVVDGVAWVPATACWYSTSGGTLTTPAAVANIGVYSNTYTGLTTGGTTPPGTPIMQYSTTNAGTATNTLSCNINGLDGRTTASKTIYVVDATFFYGVQQAALGTQVAVLASGTMNGVNVFGQIVMPTAAAGETASTVAQARADAGTLVITPVVASFNTGTTTAGAFFSVKFAPQNPFPMNDLTQYFVNLTVLCQATTATTINTPGLLVHFRTAAGV